MIELIMTGNLGKDALIKEVNGKNVINFSVCHTEKWKDPQGNLKERQHWVEAAYWTDKTTVAQYLTKGKKVLIKGTPEADSYAKQDGTTGVTLRVAQSNKIMRGQFLCN